MEWNKPDTQRKAKLTWKKQQKKNISVENDSYVGGKASAPFRASTNRATTPQAEALAAAHLRACTASKDVVHLRGPDVARVRWATPDVGGNILVHGELSNEYFLAKIWPRYRRERGL